MPFKRRLQAAFRQHGEQAGHRQRLRQPATYQQREQGRRQLPHDGFRAAARGFRFHLQDADQVAQAGRIGAAGRAHHQHRRQGRQQASGVGIEMEFATQDVGGGAVAAVAFVAQQAGLAVRRRCVRRIADVQAVRGAVRKDDDVAFAQGQAADAGAFGQRFAVRNQVIRRDAVRRAAVVKHPGGAVAAAHVQRGAHRVQGEQAAECVHDVGIETMEQIIGRFGH
jgi:hypothetical protein